MKPFFVLFSFCVLTLIYGKCEGQLSADFATDITSGCSPIVVNFSDQSQGSPSEWRWDLGNGTISTLQNPSATYFNPGFYTVKLWIKSGNNTDSVVKVSYIHVFNSPSVNFVADVTNGCSPLLVNFSDHTTLTDGNITTWQWDFGDGNLSNLQNPDHTYILSGNFNVTLKVTSNNGCTGTFRRSSYIISNRVKAAFGNFSGGTCNPNKVFFQSHSGGSGNLVHRWIFGDGTFSSEINPVHSFANAGTYTVKLILSNEFGCRDSITKDLTLTMPVKALFNSDNTTSCTAPATFNFFNQTPGTNTYYWDFGDSTSSVLMNPSHTFEDTGFYSVKLRIKNSNGCSDSLLIRNYIKVQKAYINLLGLPDSGCAPFTKYFVADVYSPDSIISYAWKLGNNISLSGQSAVYTFNTAGYYDLTLVTTSVSGCKDTTKLVKAVGVGHKPTALFSAAIRNSCASTTIAFTDQSTGNITSWEWDFGDHSNSTDQNPTHVYTDTGWMTVQLIVRDGGCIDIATYTGYIYIKPAVAKFKVITDCSNPYSRSFTNFSKGAQRWIWDFGDGTTSTAFEPVHTFPHQGLFSVTLKVWNDSTGCFYSSTKTIKIVDVSANFFAMDTVVCRGDSIIFNAVTNPEITRYYWDFGDGAYFNSVTPRAVHLYKNPGTYSVKLTVKDSIDCLHPLLKTSYIVIKGPKAKFAASAYDVCVNNSINFIDSSTASSFNPIRKWEWDYGDGRLDTLFSPPFIHSYTGEGTYKPFLKITDSMGCIDTFRIAQPILAGRVFPFFYISDSAACPGYGLRFVCPYSLPGIIYRWDFGDGGTAPSASRSVHSYTAEGIYTVKLYVSKTTGCTDSFVIANAVRIKQTKANFAISDSFSSCPPLLVNFTGSSIGAVDEQWSFGDSSYASIANPSHYYTYPGEYKAVLYANGPGGCADTIQKTIIIKGPTGHITSNQSRSCKPYQYNFTAHTENAVSYVWDFDDGVTQNGTDSLVSHVFRDSGRFVPKIILEDIAGCRVPVPSRDALTNIFVNPSFTFSDSLVCSNENLSFTNLSVSNDSIISYAWNFGDSITAVQKNPDHHYALPGIYYPSLKVATAYGCTNVYHSAFPVTASYSPSVNMLTTGSGCGPLQVVFNSYCTDADSLTMKWKWNMGNGDSSVLQNPPVEIYNNTGNYTASVSATNRAGCSSTVQKVIEVYGAPATMISGDSIVCRGNTITLHAAGAERYTWLPSINLSCDTCASITARPAVNTQYILNGISANGCSSKDTLNVKVHQPVQLQYRPSVNLCTGQSTSIPVTGAGSYKWSPPNGLSSTVSSNPVASPDTTTEYLVVGFDTEGCFRDTGHIKVNVLKGPEVKVCEDKTIAAGTPVELTATYSADVTEAYWFPNDNVSRYDPHSFLVKPTENTEYTLKVKNSAGCTTSDRVSVFVICNKNNVFIPNLFSPNNDGVNDVFYPRGTGLLKIQTLRIFNRWGETVFEKRSFNANDPSAGWDGTFKGSQLISDVFVYVVDVVCENSSVLSLRGNISLVK